MVKRTGPTNTQLIQLIRELKKKSIEDKAGLWKKVATDLEKPTRQRRIVNLTNIDKYANENEIVVVPGKVLSQGELTKKITLAAFKFSESAKEKILESHGQVMTIEELMKKNPKPSEVKVLG